MSAEHLFAERGYNGVSLRDIATEAGLSFASIRYLFGSKEYLLLHVFQRLSASIRDERKKRVKQVLDSNKGKQLEVTPLLAAALEPVFRLSRQNDTYRKLIGRSSTDPTVEIRRVANKTFEKSRLNIHKLLRSACPHLSRTEFYWRYFCYYGAMQYVLADVGRMQMIAGKDFDTSDPNTALKYVIPFLTAGLSAPSTDLKEKPKRKKSAVKRNC